MIDLEHNILYEDEDILAIDKPAGLVVHPDGRTQEDSVSEWLRIARPESGEVGEAMKAPGSEEMIERPGVVHRIDRDTSGVLLLAKTTKGYEVLKEQFQDRSVDKVYHLFVYGKVKDEFGTIKLPIGKSNSNFRKWSAERGARGEKRDALTYYKILKRGEKVTFVEAKPKTGRTHQIRVHFTAIHHPVVADKVYAPRKESELGFKRLALHARAIKFKTVSGKEVTVEAPYPEDFQNAIDNLL
jgi:23S rRNA pseudouridine1911/1915/1917 synthase